MGEVLSIKGSKAVDSPSVLRFIRSEYGLSILQAASALQSSASAVEAMEQTGLAIFPTEQIRRKYELFVGTNPPTEGLNLIFGSYPLRMARELLCLSIDAMAARFGYSRNSWKKIEANARPLPASTLREIEELVRSRLTAVCALSA